ncbi:mitotic checkpoint serine/threonine-protein kinase BUB1 beta isoform X2 [Pseudophryne corroboree]|uniref:mitotic checkpoint serine/threonine-protein kinase BUB1 beta isoform X2 n=1 Tax=Pseudophryne corroboree TaxID=495146 RepID=UPI00308155FD
MAEAADEWELSKENVQPLRQGRDMSTLQEVLSQQESTIHNAVQQKKQSFELELRFYTGDDPLDVWDRYIKWAEQAFPQGGKESNLSPLLERAVKIFHQEQRYYGDFRYLNICLKFANFCTEPIDLYSYLHSQGIGILHALLYVTWAEELEARGNYKKADSIFQEGINCRAEPLEKLEAHHKQFQARVSRRVLQGITEDADNGDSNLPEPQRSSLVDLKARGKNKARAPVSRVGDAVRSRSQGLSAPIALQQQIPSRSQIRVLDENAEVPVLGSTTLGTQPWPALPPAQAKENEQRAGTWNSGRPPRSSQMSSNEPPSSCPSFTPYVDESAEHQTVTPCKINPSVTSVLSSRKQCKEEDPLQRLQSSAQGKEEMVMYCKDKVFAGMEEFSFEEIRAEIYMVKIRKKREEDLQASALRSQEMERQIEEMEKQLKSCARSQDRVTEEPARTESCGGHGEAEPGPKVATALSPHGAETGESLRHVFAPTLPSDTPTKAQPPFDTMALSSDVPFTIFDEACSTQLSKDSPSKMPPPKRHPLTAVSKALVKEEAQLTDTLGDLEPLNEDAIVSGSDRNRTLFADPEDTCDFVRAAQLASTPFHKTRDEAEQSETPGLKRVPLREKAPLCDESYRQVVCPKKLRYEFHPILEASQEDTRSSVSSASSISTGSTSFAAKTQLVHEKLDLMSQISGVYEQTLEETSVVLGSRELRRNLLEPMHDLLASEEIHHEARQVPLIKNQETVLLGIESYHLKSEVVLGEKSRVYTGIQAGFDVDNMKSVALKVDLQPVPWDFYITQQLKQRLGEDFQTDFVKPSNCYLFQDGCISLYKDISQYTVQDILQDRESAVEGVLILLTYNLLSLVEKLHTIEIVHGDLRPETLILDDRFFELSSCTKKNSCLKLIDFSHSMDLRLCPTLTARDFPIAQTPHGQQVLANRSSPYQVDLLGIANVVHLAIFRENLQIHKEESIWKISKEIPRLSRGDFWNKFFTKILNTDCASTACVLRELRDEIKQWFAR